MSYSGVVALLLGLSHAANDLNLALSMQDGSFKIKLDGQEWLSGGNVVCNGESSANKTLTLLNAHTSSGQDAFGAYAASTFMWASSQNPSAAVMETSFRTYPSDTGLSLLDSLCMLITILSRVDCVQQGFSVWFCLLMS